MKKVLNCVCFRCSKLLLNKDDIINQNILKKPPGIRFQQLYNQCQKINRCGKVTDDGCGCLQPDNYKLDGFKWNTG